MSQEVSNFKNSILIGLPTCILESLNLKWKRRGNRNKFFIEIENIHTILGTYSIYMIKSGTYI